MDKKHRVAVVGYGNIGKFALQAIDAAPDLELAGVVRRAASMKQQTPAELSDVPVVETIEALDRVDAAILALPTRSVSAYAKQLLTLGICTVDSFDVHGQIVDLRNELHDVALKHNVAAIVAAGWDPGTDSIIRSMFEFMAPRGLTYTNFGPGMSMGHSVAAKAVAGVKNALSMTIPLGTGIHRRLIYVELEAGANFEQVKTALLQDSYFAKDESHVFQVPDVNALTDMGHGVAMERKGVSGMSHNQLLKFEMRVNNPALTSQILVSAARAALKQRPGAYTMIEVPVIDYMYGDRDDLIRRLV